MSFIGRTSGGANRVPKIPTAQNGQLQTGTTNGIIRAATWDQGSVINGNPAGFRVMLNRLPSVKSAKVDVYFNSPDGRRTAVGNSMTIQVNNLIVIGKWQTSETRIADFARGFFTFIVSVDNDAANSNKLTVAEHPATLMARRNLTDGFDR
jgi:hypothetical protein